MAFVKVDDKLPQHPKMLHATAHQPLAFGLYVAGLCYANLNRTDGFLPAGCVPFLTAAKRPRPAVQALVDAALWHEIEGGYVIHDYLKHQASAAQINSKLRRDSARKRAGSHADSEATPNGSGVEVQ